MNKTYQNLWNMLEKEVNNIEQAKSLDKNSFELLYYVTGAMDHLCNVMNKDDMDEGMSGYMPRYYMDNGMSGARRMGRYMDNAPHYDNYGYSRDNSRKRMVQKLETLMDDTMSDNERQAIQECMDRINKM